MNSGSVSAHRAAAAGTGADIGGEPEAASDDRPVTDSERKFLDLLRKADAVFIYTDDGFRTFAWIRGLSTVGAKVQVSYGKSPDDKPALRHLSIKMGVTDKEFREAVERSGRSEEQKPRLVE